MLLMIIPGKCDGEKQSWIGRWSNASNSRYSPSLPGRDRAFPESSGQAERKCPGNPQYRQHHSFMRRSRSDGEIRVPPNCIGSGDPWDSGNSSLGTGLKGGVNTNWWLNLLSLRRLSSRTARSIRASRSLEGSRVASSSLSASERPVLEAHHKRLIVPATPCCNGVKMDGIFSSTATTLLEGQQPFRCLPVTDGVIKDTLEFLFKCSIACTERGLSLPNCWSPGKGLTRKEGDDICNLGPIRGEGRWL